MTTHNMTRVALVTIVLAICSGCSNGSPTAPPATAATFSDFSGQYSGTYRVKECVTDGAFTGFCEATGLTPATTLPITLSLSQSQGTVTGSIMLGQIAGTFQGTVSGSTLNGTAVMTLSTEGGPESMTITAWNTTISGSALSGGFTIVFRVTGTTGSVTITTTIVQLTR